MVMEIYDLYVMKSTMVQMFSFENADLLAGVSCENEEESAHGKSAQTDEEQNCLQVVGRMKNKFACRQRAKTDIEQVCLQVVSKEYIQGDEKGFDHDYDDKDIRVKTKRHCGMSKRMLGEVQQTIGTKHCQKGSSKDNVSSEMAQRNDELNFLKS